VSSDARTERQGRARELAALTCELWRVRLCRIVRAARSCAARSCADGSRRRVRSVAMPGLHYWAHEPHAVLQLATCVQAESADCQRCHRATVSVNLIGMIRSCRDQAGDRQARAVRAGGGGEATVRHRLSRHQTTSARLTHMDGPRARSSAGVQSHEGERDQAQQQDSHVHRGHRASNGSVSPEIKICPCHKTGLGIQGCCVDSRCHLTHSPLVSGSTQDRMRMLRVRWRV